MRFKVRLQPSGHQYIIEPGETVLEAALRQGFAMPYSCRNGACGACKGKVLDGIVHYEEGLPPALSEAEAGQGLALFCRALPRSDLELEIHEIGAARDIPVRSLPCRVARLEQVSHDVMRVWLKLPMTERMQFLAGQYLNILMKDGRKRAFSIANAPHDDQHIELHIRRVAAGEFTDYVFDEMKEKDLLRIEGPHGSFFLREDSSRPIIFMAGGTGFAPVKSILEYAFAQGITRPMRLYWGARARRDLYLDALPRAWADQHPQFSYVPVLSDPLPGDDWPGRTGYVTDAIAADFPDLSGHEIYAAGNPAMVHSGTTLFFARGLREDSYFSDAFEFARDKPRR